MTLLRLLHGRIFSGRKCVAGRAIATVQPHCTTMADSKYTLLLVDDDPLIREGLGFMLSSHFDLLSAESRHDAMQVLQASDRQPALALIDLGLPPYPHKPDEGFQLVKELLARDHRIKVLVLSGQDDDLNIQHALTMGAVDFIAKPAESELLLARLKHHQRLYEIELKRSSQTAQTIIGDSVAMQAINNQIAQFADSPFPVLIEGASGTGKELVARALHDNSNRKNEPYLAINCAAITQELLEAQLFGHAKGAFTGATQEHKGFFMEAGEGTLLLDEIAELPLPLQGKLLRVIESGEFYRVGETQVQHSRARIIAATNRHMREEVANECFRADLYHRLSILNIQMPDLQSRGDDVFQLLEHFVQLYADSVPPFELDEGARALWGSYAYPGNIRELRNIVIRLGTKYPGQTVNRQQLADELETELSVQSLNVDATSISDDVIIEQINNKQFDLDKLLGDIEGRSIRIALEMNDNNVSKAARALNINRTTLYSRVQKLENS